MAKFSFNAEDVQDMSFDVLPEDYYVVQITGSEVKPTKGNKNNLMLVLKMEILGGDFAGRVIFDRLNIVHNNELAQKIGQSDLKRICEATGVIEIDDTEELHGIPFGVKLKVVPPRDGYDESNEVASYISEDEVEDKRENAQGGSVPTKKKPTKKPTKKKTTKKKPTKKKAKPKPPPKPKPPIEDEEEYEEEVDGDEYEEEEYDDEVDEEEYDEDSDEDEDGDDLPPWEQ